MYNPVCCSPSGDGGYKLSANNPDAFAADLAAMVELIWKAKGMPANINKKVASAFAKELWSGTTKGYGKDLIGIAYDSPDYEMLKKLQNSIYQFSAAKNHQQLKSLTQALVGDDGKLRSYSQFKNAAFKINDTHVNQWLKTEYNTAICSGQMASKWVEIQANKKTLGILEFDAVMDGRTTDLCRSLNGVRKYVDDPFWKIYYLPNHFGERSTIRQRAGGSITPDSEFERPDIPTMFQTNLAENGLVFPKGHPYFNHVPENALLSFGDANYELDTVRELRGSRGSVYESGLANNPDKQFDQRYYREYSLRVEAADKLATHFEKDVFITPELPQTDWRTPYFFKDSPFYNKYPDLKVAKEFWEVKSYEGSFDKSKISNMLKKGTGQSRNLVFKLNHTIEPEFVKKRIKNSIKDSPKMQKNIDKVLIIDEEGKVYEAFGFK